MAGQDWPARIVGSLPAMSFLPVVVATALVLGAAAGLEWPGWAWGARLAAGVGLLSAWRATVTGHSRIQLAAVVAGTGACGLLLGALALDRLQGASLVTAWREAGGEQSVPLELEGVILADATAGAGRVSFPLRVRRVRAGPCGCVSTVAGDVLVAVGGDAAAAVDGWRAGRAVTLTAVLRQATSFRNPGGESEARRLVRRRLGLIATVKSRWLVEVRQQGPWPDELAAAARARTREALGRAAGAGSDAAAVSTAVLIGDRAGLSAALEDRLQRAGTFHVIAISGGNVAVWALLALGLAARVTRHRTAGLTAAAFALVAYAAVVGGGASVLRATGMALVGIACQAADLRGAAINVLALTAGLLVAIDPPLALDIGFWLTTAATAGLVVGLPAPPPSSASRLRHLLHALVVTSVWAELALLPIAATVFQLITVAGVLLSAVAIPAMAVVQVMALLAVVVDALVPAALPAAGLALRLATAAVTESSSLVDVWTWLWWHVPPPSTAAVVVYYGLLGAWLWARREGADSRLAARLRLLSAVALPAAAVWIATAPWTLAAPAPGDLRLTLFDVGQGDAALVELPGGRRLVVDAGGAGLEGRDLGHRVVAPALRALGVRRLDYVVVTHADADHLGGAASLVREFRPGEVWVGVPVQEHAPTEALRAAVAAVGAVWREARAGDRLEAGGVVIDVRHPPSPDWQRLRPRNDDSIVLDLRWRDVRLVLSGDAGADVEAGLASTAGAAAPITLMKAGHHGSRTSTSDAWLAALRPWVVLVSVGAANPFGHPAPDVLARLAGAGVDVWRTDREGALSVRTDGRAVTIAAVSGRSRVIAARGQPR